MSPSLLDEMQILPELNASTVGPPEVEVSLIIPARNCSDFLQNTLHQAHDFLTQHVGSSFEIVIVPNGGDPESDATHQAAERLARIFTQVTVVPHHSPRGKGAAIRTGFMASRGRFIFLTDADLPYDLSFFNDALEKLKNGTDLVTGNRRLEGSHFDIPVALLPLAYGRHRIGKSFNRVVRWLLPIQSTDTQAGIKALSRRLATAAFCRQSCPGFLFDLELFLTAQAQGFTHAELPVTLHLSSEETTVRFLRESVLVVYWLAKMAWRHFKRHYHSGPQPRAHSFIPEIEHESTPASPHTLER